MFGIGGGEFLTLVVLAVVLFGPEKIPELSRKAARVVHYLRNIANNASAQLREELGPEYSNLELKDLAPKAILQKVLLDDIQSDVDEIKNDLNEVKTELDASSRDIKADLDTVVEQANEPVRSANEASKIAVVADFFASNSVPFDLEAT